MRNLILATLLAGCTLDPLVSDEPGASLHIDPPGTVVPHVDENADLARQIRVNDGLSDSALETAMGVIPLKKGYAEGQTVQYWDLGNMPELGALMYVFGRFQGETFVRDEGHPILIDSLPGDPGFSPYWFVQHVALTDRYLGEVFPTTEALADAVELGLIEEPVPAGQFVDGIVVPKGTTLSLGEGVPPQAAVEVIARGYRVDMLMIGGANAFKELDRAGRVTRGDVHTIRVGNSVGTLREPVFQNASDPWTPAVRLINCHVTQPDPEAGDVDIHDEAQLFVRDDKGAMVEATPRVMDWVITTTTKNWPIYVPEAAP
jgi:hypothetical protein